MITTTQMQLVDINKLVPYVNNARTHSPEQITKLRSSLREFGFVNPVLIDREFNVLAGHGRICAAKEEGASRKYRVYSWSIYQKHRRKRIYSPITECRLMPDGTILC